MRLANVDGFRKEPQPKMKGQCPTHGLLIIAFAVVRSCVLRCNSG